MYLISYDVEIFYLNPAAVTLIYIFVVAERATTTTTTESTTESGKM